jgi:hypothetical protein
LSSFHHYNTQYWLRLMGFIPTSIGCCKTAGTLTF